MIATIFSDDRRIKSWNTQKCILFQCDILVALKSKSLEMSDIIGNYLMDVLQKHQLTQKVISFSGDNTNNNFGDSAKKGQENVFFKLKRFLGRDIAGIGCASHIVHSAILSASNYLSVDVEFVTAHSTIWSYFYLYTVRVETFKETCDSIDFEYHKMLGSGLRQCRQWKEFWKF